MAEIKVIDRTLKTDSTHVMRIALRAVTEAMQRIHAEMWFFVNKEAPGEKSHEPAIHNMVADGKEYSFLVAYKAPTHGGGMSFGVMPVSGTARGFVISMLGGGGLVDENGDGCTCMYDRFAAAWADDMAKLAPSD